MLLAVCESHDTKVFMRDYGSALPNRGKLIREGLRSARQAIQGTPCGDHLPAWLAAVQKGLESMKERYRKDPDSDDGWHDEDGDILGGLSTMQREVQKLGGRPTSNPMDKP